MSGTLNRASFVDGLMGATRTSCMIAFILAGAAFLSVAMGFTGIPSSLAAWIGSLGLSPHMLLAALTLFFIVLGCFLDGISIVVLTTAVILPMVQAAGIDTIWFGIYLVLVVEMAQITPPVGFNLFVLPGSDRARHPVRCACRNAVFCPARAGGRAARAVPGHRHIPAGADDRDITPRARYLLFPNGHRVT